MKFKVLAGAHVIQNEPLVKVRAPGIVESDRDLVAVFGSNKFERIADDLPEPIVEPPKGEDSPAPAPTKKAK